MVLSFGKSIIKINMSDDDSLSGPEIRRKIINRIEDSDSDSDCPSKPESVNNDVDEKNKKVQFLMSVHPSIAIDQLEQALENVNWNVDDAEKYVINKRKHSIDSSQRIKKKRKRRGSDDEDVDTDEGNYKRKQAKVFDSDDDSDVEVSNHLTPYKKSVLEFMQNAQMSELLMMHQCSLKKAEGIMSARPFDNWRDLVHKFQNYKYLDTELLNSAQTLLETRNVVANLMKKCLKLSADMEKAVADGASMIKEQPKTLSPNLKLAPYQMIGLNWLAVMHSHHVNGILADEMGLGKTVQVIAFLTYIKEAGLSSPHDGPHLIVVPSSTMENWENELERWSPGLNVVQYYGSQDERREMRMGWRNGDLEDVDVIVTTYNVITKTPEERKLFKVMKTQYVIFDEAHMLKNMNTIRYDQLWRINARHRILLTGTPLQNNLLELMSLLIFVMPSIFAGKQNDLKSLFSKNPKVNTDKNNSNLPGFEKEQVDNAKLIMRPFILRRLKSEVLSDLPKKTETIIKCSLTKKQNEMYKNMMARFTEEAGQGNLNGVGMMMKLRKLANHPLLTRDYYNEQKLEIISQKLARDPTYKENNPQYVFDDLLLMSDYQINQLSRTHKCLAGMGLPQELVPQAGKLVMLDNILPTFKKDGHRVLIFSQFTMVLDVLEEYLTMRGHRFLRLDGQTPVPERGALIDEFADDPSIFIFLLSTKAGGLGINLTCADTVIIHDIDFNPYNDKQAEDRCHRVGQKKPVKIIRLLGEETIEEGMYDIAQDKLHLEAQITGNEGNENNKRSILKLLKATLGLDPHSKMLTSPISSPEKTLNGFEEEDF